MTVCVGVLANGGKEILTASDSMMAWGAGLSSETSLKLERLHARWGVMLAGEDIHPAENIIRELTLALRQFRRPTINQVEDSIRACWRTVKNRRAETHVLSQYNIDLETFIAEGLQLFGELAFAEMRAAIDRASELSCELLIYGFNAHDDGVLLVVVHPGEPVNFTRMGFAAIGSGRDSAIASLMWSPPHKTHHPTVDAIYRVCAAKFMAENALGVGEETIVVGLNSQEQMCLLENEHVERVRKLWLERGRPRVPKPSETIPIGEPEWLVSTPAEKPEPDPEG